MITGDIPKCYIIEGMVGRKIKKPRSGGLHIKYNVSQSTVISHFFFL